MSVALPPKLADTILKKFADFMRACLWAIIQAKLKRLTNLRQFLIYVIYTFIWKQLINSFGHNRIVNLEYLPSFDERF